MNEVRLISVSKHPRAGGAIRRLKARAGLFGFLFVALLGFLHGAAFEAILGRALLGGLVAYLLVWGVAVTVWKRILIAEATATARRIRAKSEADAAVAAAAAAVAVAD